MDTTISARFSGRPYDLRMRVFTSDTDIPNNRTQYRANRYAISLQGYGSYFYDAKTVDSWVAGKYLGGAYALPFGPPGNDFTGKTIALGGYDSNWLTHASDGTLKFTARIRFLNASVFGSADTGDVTLTADRNPRPPAAPTVLPISEVTPTSMRYKATSNSNGGSAITSRQLQYDDDPNFGSPTTVAFDGDVVITGLTPGTPYSTRSRDNNAYWNGAWSAVVKQTTLPATAPGITVTPALSGVSATVVLTPPGSATGVTKYHLEYRLQGTVTAPTVREQTSPTYTINGLAPGAIYEYRASAFFGTYQSPISAWVPILQPLTNTNPGDYFDGATAAKTDTTYAWLSTAHASVSRAVGRGVDGWEVTAVAGSGGTARTYQISGGYDSAFGCRAIVIEDFTTAGMRLGMQNLSGKRATVVPDGMYFGSIRVRPSRAQRMAAALIYMNSSGTVLQTIVGAESIVDDLDEYTRLYANGTCPPGATQAIVVATDVVGSGHSPWIGGEWLDGDRTQVTLGGLFDEFDGSTPDVSGYDFDWVGPADESESTRTTVPVALFDPLADPDCIPLPSPPLPPVILADCITETGTWRRYTVQVPGGEVRRWTSTLPTLILQTSTAAERQVRIRFYPNPNGVVPEALDQDSWDAEQILTYIPPMSIFTLDAVTRRVWAEVNGGPRRSADHLLFGTGGVPASWPELACGTGYVITLDVPTEAPSGNLTTRLALTQKV